jgi:two-component system, LytTR family, sensor kinase
VNKNWLKYSFRISIILILDSLIRGFDNSFDGVFNLSGRSIFFFFSFLFFWMITWAISSWIINETHKSLQGRIKSVLSFVIVSNIILFLSIGAAILFNFLYRLYDINLFGMKENWASVPFPHPELIYPLALVSILIFTFDIFIKYSTHLKDVELYTAHLEQDNIQAKYETLKNQVDPHFLFNSLSVLSSIVYTDPEMSSEYIHNLSKLYRYSLETTQKNVVPLIDELNFLDSYIFLIKIRYPDSIRFKIKLDRSKIEQLVILPYSLQLLIENSIKHNTFKDDNPLEIEVLEEDEFICVSNQIRKKKQLTPSPGIGLENIRSRYDLLYKKKIVIMETDCNFTVKLPKINITQNEDSNR